MGFAESEAAIIVEFETEYAGLTPIVWQNVAAEPDGEHVVFSIQHGNAAQRSKGVIGRFDYIGLVRVRVKVPVKTGSRRAAAIADTVSDIFISLRLVISTAPGAGEDVLFFTPRVVKITEEMESGADDEFYKLDVICPFRRSVHKTTPTP